MKRSELKELMLDHCIVECELEDVCDFVSELLYRRAKELEKNEPYATRTIQKYEDAAYEAYDLINYIAEMEEDDEDENS